MLIVFITAVAAAASTVVVINHSKWNFMIFLLLISPLRLVIVVVTEMISPFNNVFVAIIMWHLQNKSKFIHCNNLCM